MHPNDVLLDGTRQRVLCYHTFMASRKPSSIVSPWLGASKNITVAGKTSVNSTGSSEAQIDTGGGERDKVNETLMLGVAGAAGVTAATLGARRSGLPARVVNKVKGQTVLLHGSPVSKLKEIKPSLSPSAIREGYTTPEAYAVNPIKTRSLAKAWRDAADYAQLSGSGVKGAGGGSVYIVKGKTSGFTSPLDSPVVSSLQPLRVIKEYPAMTGSSNFVKDLKRAGIKLPKKR